MSIAPATPGWTERSPSRCARAGPAGARIVEQFAREARAISALNHPHICLLHDIGRHESIDFLVMEYVEGEPITDYCSRLSLGTRERVRMFCAVCEGVHYAHQNLVVHRDLKPANILVTGEGQPKFLDFGIAKLLDAPAPGQTATLARVLTPDNVASPEQVRGSVSRPPRTCIRSASFSTSCAPAGGPIRFAPRLWKTSSATVCETQPVPPSAVVREMQQTRGGAFPFAAHAGPDRVAPSERPAMSLADTARERPRRARHLWKPTRYLRESIGIP